MAVESLTRAGSTMTEEARSLDARYLMQNYGPRDTLFVRGEGTRLYDAQGNEYLDFLSGIAVCPLGHADPDVTAAIREQAGKIVQTSNYFLAEHRGQVAKRLSDLAGGDALGWRTFFANSGAEANECAMKVARRVGVERHGEGCQTIVVLNGSFHGRTMETLAATAQGWLQAPFQPLPGGFRSVDRNDLAALDAAMGPDVCAIMMEPIQGESGVWVLTDEYLRHVREVADSHDALVIFDEVQTGLFRCGRPFAFQTVEGVGENGVVPDIFTVAKGIASGVPCAACVARGDAATVLTPGQQGSTFGGGPLAMAAADATLEKMVRLRLDERAERMGAYLRERLATVPYVTQVRGKGLMVGASIEGHDAHDVVAAMLRDRHVVINACNATVLRFLPSLVIERADVDAMVEALSSLA
ncbi:MAG: aminotransferase class III-fold pyridoxal phosphate-dependent enzyme [Coriobacteriales bacterium]|jgi:acetylornithine/N-succinyldiaminopimelate aminotransferase